MHIRTIINVEISDDNEQTNNVCVEALGIGE